MAAAAISGNYPARAFDDEIRDLAVNGPRLSATVRAAVRAVLDALLAEGGLDRRQAEAAQALREALAQAGLPHAA